MPQPSAQWSAASPNGSAQNRALLPNGGARKPSRLMEVMISILPSVIFCLVLCLFTFAYDDFKVVVWALTIACILLSCLFVAIGYASGRGTHLAVGIFCFAAVAAAVPVGMIVANGNMAEYWRLDSGGTYKNLGPNEPAVSHADATVLEFTTGSFVDGDRSVGYMRAGKVYCAAPVSGPVKPAQAQPPPYEYWAVGEDCCDQKGGFDCGAVHDDGARSGIVMPDDREQYVMASRMSVATYELPEAKGAPTFVKWVKDPGNYKDGLWNSSVTLVLVASAVHLVASVVAALFVIRALTRKADQKKP